MPEDTIAAISTPPGEGGIGIVRLSGPDALAVAGQVFLSSRGRDLAPGKRRGYHGHVTDAEGCFLDEVLVQVMPGPHSYTREDVVEIHGHGGAGPLNAVLARVLESGARLAGPGEFTLRAFLNGRIDLVQAEAVIDQIRARTRAGLQAAQAAAGGKLSGALHAMKETLVHALARVEATVDFPEEEDVPDALTGEVLAELASAQREMGRLLATADAGRLVREGAAAAIAGRPNVGKSSLFNALLRDARAIVSARPGTTRDRLEEYITIGGAPVLLIDTAGLRGTDDEVERIGVERAREALAHAQAVLFVVDASEAYTQEDEALGREAAALDVPVVMVLNKCDLRPGAAPPDWGWRPRAVCRVSAATGEGLEELEAALGEIMLGGVNLAAGDAMLNRLHQKDSLRRASEAVGRLLEAPDLAPEFLALELREALEALGEITGETTPEDVLDTIFSSFCIGK